MKTKTTTPNPTMPTNGTTTVGQLGPRASNGGGPSFQPQEPVFWITTAETSRRTGAHQWKGNNIVRTKDGIERRPSVACSGESDYQNRRVHSRAHSRYQRRLDSAGHTVFAVVSNAAAHLPHIIEGKWSSDGYAADRLRKFYALGWIDVEAGCVKRQVADGLVNPRRLLVDVSTAKVCGKDATTCKHIEAEKAARQAKNAAAMAAIEAKNTAPDPSIAIGIAVAKALADHAAKVKP